MRLAFLFLDDIHHIFHSAPIAHALLQQSGHAGLEIDLLASTPKNRAILEGMLAQWQTPNAQVVNLDAPLWQKLTYRLKRNFPRKSTVLKKHLQQLSQYDALVATDFTSRKLKQWIGTRCPKLVFTFHGAGDRQYGFREDIGHYDLLLIPGEKVQDRLKRLGLLEHCEWAVTGYPKFDNNSCSYPDITKLFPNTPDRRTVIYNPHFSRALSSWFDAGPAVLDYFAQSDRYNLIFAPHLMLFRSPSSRAQLKRWERLEHVHIDCGSRAGSDLSYTRMADYYLGDASSQIYEFLRAPAYCLFLNTHPRQDWQQDESFTHWRLGDVIRTDENPIQQMDACLADAAYRQSLYREIQQTLIDQTFSQVEGQPASQRAAAALMEYLKNGKIVSANLPYAVGAGT